MVVGLAHDLVEDDRLHATFLELGERTACTHAGELLHVADQHEAGIGVAGAGDELVGVARGEYAGLVNDPHLAALLCLGGVGEQHALDRHVLGIDGTAEQLSSGACRGHRADGEAVGARRLGEGRDDGRGLGGASRALESGDAVGGREQRLRRVFLPLGKYVPALGRAQLGGFDDALGADAAVERGQRAAPLALDAKHVPLGIDGLARGIVGCTLCHARRMADDEHLGVLGAVDRGADVGVIGVAPRPDAGTAFESRGREDGVVLADMGSRERDRLVG